MEVEIPRFDDDTWEMLPSFFEHLPKSVLLNIWGDANSSISVSEALKLAQDLSQRFERIEHQILPMRVNFDYYPVIGIFGIVEDAPHDYGVRIIGLPVGYQMTSLIAGIQAVSFQGSTSEAKTRIQLHRLAQPVDLELFTSAEDESGALMASAIFNMAVVNEHVRAYLVMRDEFPTAAVRYSVDSVPHLVINGKGHIQGMVEEETILKSIASVLQLG